MGKWISEKSNDGWSDIFGYEEVVAEFPDASKNEMLEAVGELELEDMVSISKCLGKPFSHIRATHKLFEVFDPIVFQNVNPREDAATIANELLTSESGVSASDLSEQHGWSVRRINPDFATVGEFMADGRKSRSRGQPYVIRSMFVDAQERARLRRFVNQVSGN